MYKNAIYVCLGGLFTNICGQQNTYMLICNYSTLLITIFVAAMQLDVFQFLFNLRKRKS